MLEHPSQHLILVSGATGQQGGAVARHLLDRGFQVRALTRDPEQDAARALADRGANVMKGDFDDCAFLNRALEGAYGAYSVQVPWGPEGAGGEIRQGKAFAEVAKDAHLRHFVYSSSAGASRGTDVVHANSKGEIEAYISELGLPATILRPTFFMDNWMRFKAPFKGSILSGKIPLPLSPDTRLPQIAVDDVGICAARAFSNPDEWLGRTVKLIGDEPTMEEMAEIFGRVLGREVNYVQVPWQAFAERIGAGMIAMWRGFERQGQGRSRGEAPTYPWLKPLEVFLRGQGWT